MKTITQAQLDELLDRYYNSGDYRRSLTISEARNRFWSGGHFGSDDNGRSLGSEKKFDFSKMLQDNGYCKTLSNINLSKRTLTNINFKDITFQSCDFRNTDFQYSCFPGANFHDVKVGANQDTHPGTTDERLKKYIRTQAEKGRSTKKQLTLVFATHFNANGNGEKRGRGDDDDHSNSNSNSKRRRCAPGASSDE